MSYQVLARKWRPQRFSEMVGQRHVLRALINALEQDRLHHAYLFTGTRGVGKTTIARLFAKALNCEAGVSSEPCGSCGSCVEIAENRFVDLIEVDAASRTRVEDTRDLLDNVQYAPTRGRYKVYLIDEVHMLSSHSFNALLKTLEEPPPHVKFLLATTDPQKLPVTVLSRCLQFNLKQMTPTLIADYLQQVLTTEGVHFEAPALELLGRAALGSMRDALSLTDQAISYGQGQLLEADVATMLGTVDRQQVFALITALFAQDGRALLQHLQAMSEFAPDWPALMAEVLAVLHRLTVLQIAPEYQPPYDSESLRSLADQCDPDDVQLYYQLGLQAYHDLTLAPDPQQGFEMALLRMLAFTPEPPPSRGRLEREQLSRKSSSTTMDESDSSVDATSETSSSLSSESSVSDSFAVPTAAPVVDEPRSSQPAVLESAAPDPTNEAPWATEQPPQTENIPTIPESFSAETQRAIDQVQTNVEALADHWLDLIPAFEVSGVLENLLRHTVVSRHEDACLVLHTEPSYEAMFDKRYEQVLLEALQILDLPIRKVIFEFAQSDFETLHQRDLRQRQEALKLARHALEQDALVQLLQQEFQAEIMVETIIPGEMASNDLDSDPLKRQAS